MHRVQAELGHILKPHPQYNPVSCAQTCRSLSAGLFTHQVLVRKPQEQVFTKRGPSPPQPSPTRPERDGQQARPRLVRPTTPLRQQVKWGSSAPPRNTSESIGPVSKSKEQPGTAAATLGQLWRGLSWNWHHLELTHVR